MTESVKRWVRRHRPDGNPLRRRSDRLESAALAVAMLFILLSVWPAVVAGRQAYEGAQRAGAETGAGGWRRRCWRTRRSRACHSGRSPGVS
ncbi:hypothetical protein [Nonomuraea sp. CA-141351]|uniref:hypothetical protein n=1 Tax=Nonomuraea sp. CA-141351 TaxID=3239996 RepID=UPI003D8F44B9